MDFLREFKRLSGVTDSRVVTEAVTEKTIGYVKKIAKKTKMGDYDVREVHAALDAIDPGWKLEVTVGAMPLKDGPLHAGLNLDVQRAFEKQYGLSHTDMTYYAPTSASLSWAWRTDGGPAPTSGSQTQMTARSERPSKQEVEATTKAFLDLLLKGVVQQKDPASPEAGVTYIAPLGKPKTEESASQHVEGITFLTLTWKISSVKRGVEVTRLTSPKGEVIDLEGPSPALWTKLYKTDIDKKAQTYLDNEGIAAKDAQKKAMKGYSSNDVIGTCGICHNVQKLRSNALVLHGYQRPGYGWIQGSCFGVGYQPWELSPESVEAYIKYLDKAIPSQKNTVNSLKTAKSFLVLIDDKHLVKGSGQGYRKYNVTKDGFELADERKYAGSERQKLGIPTAYDVWALDATNAEKVFEKRKDDAVRNAESQLAQMIQVRKDCVKEVADWKPRPLPGAAIEMTDLRKLAGITETRWWRK